jgi:hypothetical protein
MTQNVYDDPEFFAGYSRPGRSVEGLAGAAEWPALRALLPDMTPTLPIRRNRCGRAARRGRPKERCMDNTVDVVIPLDAEAARILDSSARREAVGRYLSSLLKSGHVRDALAEAIAEAKREARHAGLTDGEVDAELDAWRAAR